MTRRAERTTTNTGRAPHPTVFWLRLARAGAIGVLGLVRTVASAGRDSALKGRGMKGLATRLGGWLKTFVAIFGAMREFEGRLRHPLRHVVMSRHVLVRPGNACDS